MKKLWIAALSALLLLPSLVPAPAQAQKKLSPDELRKLPGYVDFGDIWEYSDGEEEVEIDLTQPLLGVVGSFVRSEDPDLADLILDLHLVRVNQFSFEEKDRDRVRKLVDNTARKLRSQSWDNIVKVREGGERVNVFVQFDGEQTDAEDTYLTGLTILVLEEDAAAFINVVGRFRLQDIARVGAQFDIPYAQDFDQFNARAKRGSESDREEDQ